MHLDSDKSVDIFQLLEDTTKKHKKKQREELLTQIGIEDIFTEGSITINKKTCRGIECKLCIKACPTSALYWRNGEVGITKELCIYCGACVVSCIVDDCIVVSRKRKGGESEVFSKPKDFTILQHRANARKRYARVDEARDLFPKPAEYIKRRKEQS